MQAKKFSSAVGKIVLALALTSVIGGTSTGPAFADDNGRHEGQRERGERNRGHDRDRGERHGERDRGEYRSYPYVYAPPPVVYAPYPSPGIGLFFDFR
jgi:hypothetical protein